MTTAEASASALVACALVACGSATAARDPSATVELVELAGAEAETDEDRAARLQTLRASSSCDGAPLHAVLEEQAASGDRWLGFCDGTLLTLRAAGGSVLEDVDGELPVARPVGWERRSFAVDGLYLSTDVPERVRAIGQGDRVRLLGKFFDLYVRRASPSEAFHAPQSCEVTLRTPTAFVCRTPRGHRVLALVPIRGASLRVESEPRLAATPQAAAAMLRAAQTLHRPAPRDVRAQAAGALIDDRAGE